MSNSHRLPLAYYKVLLVQIITRIVDQIEDTGFKEGSKRNILCTEVKASVDKLERELKKNVNLHEAKAEKQGLFDEIYEQGNLPTWLLDVVFKSLTEESKKLAVRKGRDL